MDGLTNPTAKIHSERSSSMKKLSVLLAMSVLMALLVVPASAAPAITWTSGWQIQNLDATNTAHISISYYNQDGTKNIADVSDTIPAMSSKTYYPIHANTGFNGSVVVSSDTKVVAIANTLGNSPQYAASTESFSTGASSVKLPLIMRGNAGYYTWFNVQNTGSADASVTVQYIPGSAGSDYTSPAVTIKPGAAATFNQYDMTQLGSPFIGSAVVNATGSTIVATVMQVGETYKNMMGYNGFTGGSSTVNLPLVMSNNSGYYTGFQVQNVGTANTTITIHYGPNLAGTFAPVDETATLNPNEAKTFLQNTGQFATQKYVGSATITASQPIVAICNQVKMTGVVLGTAYNGFDPAAATDKVSAPLIMQANSGYYTGIQVMNVGSSAITVTITYGPNAVGSYVPPMETVTNLQPGASYNSITNGTQKYVGSLTAVASAGGKIVMIVNEIWPAAPGDQFMTYNGFNY